MLEPWDFIHAPPGVVWTFRNVGDEQGALLVIVQGPRDEFDDVQHSSYVFQQLADKFGSCAAEQLRGMGKNLYSAGAAK